MPRKAIELGLVCCLSKLSRLLAFDLNEKQHSGPAGRPTAGGSFFAHSKIGDDRTLIPVTEQRKHEFSQTVDGEEYSAQVFRSTPEVELQTGSSYYLMDVETGEIISHYKDAPSVELVASDFEKFCKSLGQSKRDEAEEQMCVYAKVALNNGSSLDELIRQLKQAFAEVLEQTGT